MQGYNPYAYAANNPTTFTDPTGHFVEEALVAASLIPVFLGIKQMVEAYRRAPTAARGLLSALMSLVMLALQPLILVAAMGAAAKLFAGMGRGRQ